MPHFDAEAAKTEVYKTLFRAVRSYTATSALAALASAAPESLLPIYEARAEAGMKSVESILGMNQQCLPLLSQGMGVPDPLAFFKKQSEISSVLGTQEAISAACMVFSHSLADVAISDLCLIAAAFDPRYWVRIVESQTVSIKRIAEESSDTLIQKQIRTKIYQMSSARVNSFETLPDGIY
jgi:hypothetical protein